MSGLNEKDAQRLLLENGKNEITDSGKKTALALFLSQFRDILILILAAGAVFSAAVGEIYEAVSIIAIMLLNALMGFIQEFRTEKTIEALKKLSAPTAAVIRSGLERRIPASDVVKGDTVSLKSGDRVPADIEIVSSNMLETDESLLTGESKHIKKTVGSRAYMGSCAVAGNGVGIVSAVGMDTEMGRIAKLLGGIKEAPTPLQIKLGALSRFIAIGCVSVCAVVAVAGLVQGSEPLEMILTGISLAVAAIPEGLPAVVTIVLSTSVGRIVKKGAIIRKLHSVETLGCASVICCDKTGTLTENRMTVRRLYCEGRLYESDNHELAAAAKRDSGIYRMLCAAALCSDAKQVTDKKGVHFVGSPTESALASSVYSYGIKPSALMFERTNELPFDSARKYMTVTGKRADGTTATYIKGAPDRVAAMCNFLLVGEGEAAFDAPRKRRISEVCSQLASESYRLIACAQQTRNRTVFLGVFGIEDPLRKEIKSAVERCKGAGVRAVMITGDHEQTARAVAKQAGILSSSGVLSGPELDALNDSQLRAAAARVNVYARVSPEHKLKIVRALRANGEVVAMTGDGVNDAPAVKEADIGVAMGISGTDVTKQASGVIITDDNFATIVSAVEEGRMIYNNIKRFVLYLLTCNLGEVLTVVIGMLMGYPAIFAPIQLLLINLITDGLPALALGMETDSEGLMQRPPRKRSEGLFSDNGVLGVVCRGSVLALCNILCYCLTRAAFGHEQASSAAYITLVAAQMAFVSERRIIAFFRRSKKNKNYAVAAAAAVSLAATAATVYLPFLQRIFSTVSVGSGVLLICAGCVLISTVIGAAISKISGFKV